jgi:HSF-type DNA-binding
MLHKPPKDRDPGYVKSGCSAMSGTESQDLSSIGTECSSGTEPKTTSNKAIEQSSQVDSTSDLHSTPADNCHEYQDRSCVPLGQQVRPSKKTSLVLFPVKLFQMLNLVDKDRLSHIISWQPHGRCFVVRKPQELKEVLHRYMPGIKEIRSFQRQVSLIGKSSMPAVKLPHPFFPLFSFRRPSASPLRLQATYEVRI